MKPATAWPPQLFGCLLMSAVSLAVDTVPRVTFRRGDSSRILTPFSKPGVLSYNTFLLSKDGATLYVGAKDTILSLDISNAWSIKLKGEISWRPIPKKREECIFKRNNVETDCYNFICILVALNETHIYTCGTNAFNPTCAYIDVKTFTLVNDAKGQPVLLPGKGLCPYDPQHRNTATFVDDELYTATMNNFQGSEPVISRTLGSRVALKTDSSLSWTHGDAVFVASFSIPQPTDDDKVYFFFEETAKEFDFFEKLTVSRVARVCKNDVGGDKVLQRKWTTFLKAQLTCIQPGLFPHAVIQHAFAAPQPGGGTVIYGVFASQWQADPHRTSAVCSFSLQAVQKAFEGKYKDFNKDCFRWTTYEGPVPEPRPGSCSVGSSSDKALTFIKEHFMMDEMIDPIHHKPLLVQHEVKYTRIVVHQTQDTLGTLYNVLFLGTDKGFLHKAVVVGSGVHIIEEIQLFGKPEAVQNLLLSPETGVLYVGSSQEVLRVPLANCSAYPTCADCLLARDPYCAWGRGKCRNIREATMDKSAWLQDIVMTKPGLGCQRSSRKGASSPESRSDPVGVPTKVLSAPLHSMVRLPCPRNSALANYSWSFPRQKMQDTMVRENDQALVVLVQKDTLGTYECWADESGCRHLVAQYQVRSASPVESLHTYWVQFVSVTVLLAMALAGALAAAFFTYHKKLKAKSKVQACSTPEPSKAPGQDKGPLNTNQNAPQGNDYQMQAGPSQAAAAGSPKACCVQVDGAFQDTDAENNRLGPGVANGEGCRGTVAVAVAGI